MSNQCPCGSGLELSKCCGPYISGEAVAPTAEALMRSRYTAYVLKELDYLKATLAPEALKDHDDASVRQWAESADWMGLTIHDTWAGLEGDEAGIVEFSAQYAIDGEEQTHRERSRFHFLDGKWLYVDGQMVAGPPIRKEPKIGRNEPCPCGSGKKYKKCCGR
ncbi:MAG: YchJ family protein [Pseudodesulfovibrio sp.]|uniref:YchJ family protein n=1 Tax=Pseudodesulfovibrio sp. TaxID=2035812 RepID=UPI003D13EE00